MADELGSPKTGVSDSAKTVVLGGGFTTTGQYFTELFLTSASPSPDNSGTFVPRTTPGNVGVCLSGGGSRAFTAGIGQLQALQALQANGSSLLNQTRALTTVSGGGWIGIPFVFLPASVSDSDFLGTYVEPANLTLDGLGDLPAQGIANYITSGFSLADLAVQAVVLYSEGVPSSETSLIAVKLRDAVPSPGAVTPTIRSTTLLVVTGSMSIICGARSSPSC